jgi:predicted RNA-binding protein associated with RNAse of E/G family
VSLPEVIVHKLDARGREIWRYRGVLLHDGPSERRLMARFDRMRVDVGGLVLARGDVFLETFYADRWYNVFEIYDSERTRRKGWYCNITRPARFTSGHIYAEDLALDMVVLPDGSTAVLDEDEFEALRLTQEEDHASRQAITQLLGLARAHSGPFGASPSLPPLPPLPPI